MTIRLTTADMRAIFQRAPQVIIDAFVSKQDVLTKAGINHTRQRLKYFFANIEHECGGFTIKNLTENINYTAEGMAKTWPTRFSKGAAGAAEVRAKFGTAKGWQKKAFNEIYGGRMGNRPGTSDGSLFIGTGGPQWTGRDGFEALARILFDLVPSLGKLTAEQALVIARDPKMQPEVCAAFWMWKKLNAKADIGDFIGCVKIWNGGTNGLADRKALMAGNDPIIMRLQNVEKIEATVNALPGKPPTATPPKEVIDAATVNERGLRTGANGVGVGGAGNEVAVSTGAVATNQSPTTSHVVYVVVGVSVVIAIVATILIARKKAKIIKNWF